MTALKHKLGTILRGAGRFCYELICPRTREEYACLLVSGQGQPERRSRYPWLFLRVFAALLGLYSVCVLFQLIFDTNYTISAVVGAFLFSLPVLVLAYELCPDTGMGLAWLTACAVIGGGLALASPIDTLWYPKGDVLRPLSVGILEETEKAVVAIVILLISKRKKPVEGLLIGAAVGCGFGAYENVMYLMNASTSELIKHTFARGVMQYVTHIGLTAAVGWAFRRFKRPLIHPAFWSVLAGAMALHALWDTKVFDTLPAFLLTKICGTTVFYWIKHDGIYWLMTVFWFLVIRKARREYPLPEADAAPVRRFTRTHAAALSLAAALTVTAGLGCLYVYEHQDGKSFEYPVGTVDEFVSRMQGGLVVCPDRSRPFDPNYESKVLRYEDGQITYAEQIVPGTGGVLWRYYYYLDEESGELTDDGWPPSMIIQTEDEYGPCETFVYPEQLDRIGYDRRTDDGVEGVDYIFYYPVCYGECLWPELPEELMYGLPKVKDGQVVYSGKVDTTLLDSPSDKALVIAAGA